MHHCLLLEFEGSFEFGYQKACKDFSLKATSLVGTSSLHWSFFTCRTLFKYLKLINSVSSSLRSLSSFCSIHTSTNGFQPRSSISTKTIPARETVASEAIARFRLRIAAELDLWELFCLRCSESRFVVIQNWVHAFNPESIYGSI